MLHRTRERRHLHPAAISQQQTCVDMLVDSDTLSVSLLYPRGADAHTVSNKEALARFREDLHALERFHLPPGDD